MVFVKQLFIHAIRSTKNIGHRTFHSAVMLNGVQNEIAARKYKEITIPVPWGHLKGKWWEPYDRRPILSLHGWQDNCGTFDRLVPLLPRSVGFLTIDSPGHGLSSRYPPGMPYHTPNNSVLLRYLIELFKWPKISLMGHSLGGIMSCMYTTYFPESVDFLICMDGVKPFSYTPGQMISKIAKSMDDYMRYEELLNNGKEPPSYTYAEMEQLLHASGRKSVAIENCKYLLERSIAPSKLHPGKHYFTRDPRLKAGPLTVMLHEDILAHMKRITCPVLITKAKLSTYFDKKELVYETLEQIKSSAADCRYYYVDGTHHAHLNNPEGFVEIISDFIATHDVEDRTGGGIEHVLTK